MVYARHIAPMEPAARDPRLAVILNKNAKRVGERVRRRIERLEHSADVFYTEDLDQAAFVTRRVVDNGYGTVITGGGDGTVVHTIQSVLDRADERGLPRPRFGVLKLGTGNAIADFLGAGRYDEDLQRLPLAPTRNLDLIRLGDGRRTTFGGLGWDAFILDNYHRLRQAADRFALTRLVFKSAAGYLIAGIGKSVPEFLIHRPRWRLRITNTGGVGLRLDPQGNTLARYRPGEVVYDGYVRMACFGTTPYYGFKFNIMPHADRTPGTFHLRLFDMNPIAALRRLRKAWIGELEHPTLTDLLLSRAHIEILEGDAPLQIGGDAAGRFEHLDIGLDAPIECAHFPA